MKKFLSMMLLLCLLSGAFLTGQTEKGRLVFGGEAYLNMTDQMVTNVGLRPQFGGFPVKNFAILGLLHFSLGYSSLSYYNGFNLGGGTEMRYYVGGEKIKFYVHGSVIPHMYYSGQPRFAIVGGGGPALAVFPNSHLSLNTSLFIGAYRLFANANPSFSLNFNVVINGLFTKKKTEQTLE